MGVFGNTLDDALFILAYGFYLPKPFQTNFLTKKAPYEANFAGFWVLKSSASVFYFRHSYRTIDSAT